MNWRSTNIDAESAIDSLKLETSQKSPQQGSNDGHNPDPKQIEHCAYELYMDRGCDTGRDLEDWLRAERELKGQGEAAPAKIAF